MTFSNLADYLEAKRNEIDTALHQAIPTSWPVPDKLREAAEYSLFAGGKRLRPIFVLAAAEAVAGDRSAAARALPFATAIEFVHTYSLIHDDLPALDNDDTRRGHPTSHVMFGEALAILAGDGLLTHAFHAASQAVRCGVSAERTLAFIGELSQYAGFAGMVGGQVEDMFGMQGVTTMEQLASIHLRKTSDLIACSLRGGGHAAEASERELEALGQFGRKLGLAFQIQDDILDLTGDEAKLGKPVRSDVQQEKVTFPYLIGLEASRDQVRRLTEEAKEALSGAGLLDPSMLLAIADHIMARDH